MRVDAGAAKCYNIMEYRKSNQRSNTMNDYNEIGARLRELREVSDYTIEDLAAELNLKP